MGNRRATIEEIRTLVEKEGCKLISNEYINSGTKLDMRCECGDIFKVNMEKFKAGQNRCNKCVRIRISNKQRTSLEDIIKLLKENSNSELLTTKYKNCKQKLDIKCSCGEIFKRDFDALKNKKIFTCVKCSNEERLLKARLKNIKLAQENILQTPCKWIGGEYINRESELMFECSCGEVFTRRYGEYIRARNGFTCKFCYENTKKRIEEIRNLINSSGCEYVDERNDITKSDKVKIKCTCGNIFYQSYFDFKGLLYKCCEGCSDINKFDKNSVKEYIEGNSKCILVSDEYKNMRSKLKIRCECGDEFVTTFLSFKFANKRQCDKCGYKISAEKMMLGYDEVKRRVEFNGLKLISKKYHKLSEKIELKCTCGRMFWKSLANISKSPYCDKCTGCSKGELRISLYLEAEDIDFTRERKFNDCRGDRKVLSFDFELNIENKTILVEYDGIQHYQATKFHTNQSKEDIEVSFKKTKRYDKIKDEYCKKNNIPLIRIPYWDFNNIEEILEKELSKYKDFEEVV